MQGLRIQSNSIKKLGLWIILSCIVKQAIDVFFLSIEKSFEPEVRSIIVLEQRAPNPMKYNCLKVRVSDPI